jgi:predicted AlkP superfamily phosphohydrolase/phosphomutase
MIVSDHGFHTWRKAVNLNTWLVEKGYMVLNNQRPRVKRTRRISLAAAPTSRTSTGAKTRAYAMASARSISTCARREGQGIVSPGAEYTALSR